MHWFRRKTKLRPKVVLGIAAHGDDIECCGGGTAAGFVAEGAEVYYLILTGGGNGTADRTLSQANVITIREAEQWAAANAAGIRKVFFGNFTDGELENTRDVRQLIVRIIRTVRPDLVMSWDPMFIDDPALGIINHHDHRTAGEATHRAVYPEARDHFSFPELLEEGLEPHKVGTLLQFCCTSRANYRVHNRHRPRQHAWVVPAGRRETCLLAIHRHRALN